MAIAAVAVAALVVVFRPPAPPGPGRRRLVGVLVFVRLDSVRGGGEGALFGADVDERSLDPRQDRVDLAEVDVAHRTAGIGTIDQQLNKAVVLEDGHSRLARVAADQDFALQSMYPRSRSASSHPGSCGCPSRTGVRLCDRRMR